MPNIVGKTVVTGALAASLAMMVPLSAVAVYPEFVGPPVYVDAYNATLAATVPSSAQTVALNVEFSGRPVYLDPYNVTLAAELSPVRTGAIDDLYNSYAFAPDYPRLWEGAASSDRQ